MVKYLCILTLLLATNAFAQAPWIDSMSVDETNSQLIVHGDFDWYQGKVYVDSVEMSILSWSDSLIVTHLPSGGRGYAGPVVVGSRGYRSEPRMLTAWEIVGEIVLYDYSGNSGQDHAYEQWSARWRAGLESQLRLSRPIMTSPLKVDVASNEMYVHYRYWYDHSNPNNSIRESEEKFGGGVTGGVLLPNTWTASLTLKDWVNRPYTIGTNVVNIILDESLVPIVQSGQHFSWGNGYPGVNSLAFPPPKALLALLHIPKLLYPAFDTSITSSDTTFLGWTSAGWFDRYQLQLSNDSTFSTILIDSPISALSFAFKEIGSTDTIYWRVRGVNSEGTSQWSESRRFLLHSTEDVGNSSQIAVEALSCAPNPANTELTFSLPTASNGWLVLCDLQGKLIRKESTNNANKLRWDVSQIPSGAYIVGLVINGKLESRTIQIVH